MKINCCNAQESYNDPDIQILECLSSNNPNNFFLFAGAGSGKTGSLVKALLHIENSMGHKFRITNQKVGVITYTNAACEEIIRRVDYSTLFQISTIHSFSWSLIKGFDSDIRLWLKDKLNSDINELLEKGRKGTDASNKRLEDIDSRRKRLVSLDSIKKFRYDPLGNNRENDSLQHSDVLQICASFIDNKSLMKQILINNFPILLIDESQDTNKDILDAVMTLASNHSGGFILGLFGDMMQRIYFDGKENIRKSIPSNWAIPQKNTNYRSPKRIVKLLNDIRAPIDDHFQHPFKTDEGFARIFIRNHEVTNKASEEACIRVKMSEISGDVKWNDLSACKILLLEHHMAAMRYGFTDVFMPLYEISDWKNSLLDGTHPALSFLTKIVVPFYDAIQNNQEREIMSLLRLESPLLNKKSLGCVEEPSAYLSDIAQRVAEVKNKWNTITSPSCGDVLRALRDADIFTFPEVLDIEIPLTPDDRQSDSFDARTKAILHLLGAPLDEIRAYHKYVTGQTPFGTHHGIKGLEFERVIVVLDDSSARGKWFSYDKIFGATPKTKTDLENLKSGKESSLDRTMRLLYVTCSRATKSLAVVV